MYRGHGENILMIKRMNVGSSLAGPIIFSLFDPSLLPSAICQFIIQQWHQTKDQNTIGKDPPYTGALILYFE